MSSQQYILEITVNAQEGFDKVHEELMKVPQEGDDLFIVAKNAVDAKMTDIQDMLQKLELRLMQPTPPGINAPVINQETLKSEWTSLRSLLNRLVLAAGSLIHQNNEFCTALIQARVITTKHINYTPTTMEQPPNKRPSSPQHLSNDSVVIIEENESTSQAVDNDAPSIIIIDSDDTRHESESSIELQESQDSVICIDSANTSVAVDVSTETRDISHASTPRSLIRDESYADESSVVSEDFSQEFKMPEIQRNMFGGGKKRRHSVAPVETTKKLRVDLQSFGVGSSTAPVVYELASDIKSLQFVTEAELKFFRQFTVFDKPVNMERINSERLACEASLQFCNLSELPPTLTIGDALERLMEIFIRVGLSLAGGDLKTTKFAIGLNTNNKTGSAFWRNGRTYEMLNGEVLSAELEKISQSNESVVVDNTFKISMHVFKPSNLMTGAGRQGTVKYFDFVAKAREHVVGKTKCLLKAIFIGKTRADYNAETDAAEKRALEMKWRGLTRNDRLAMRERRQMEGAQMIETEVDLEIKDTHNANDLATVADYYSDYCFMVYQRPNHKFRYVLEKTLNTGAQKKITIAYKDGHYDYLRPTETAVEERHCTACDLYVTARNHKCAKQCLNCGVRGCTLPPVGQEYTRQCSDCNCIFYSEQCFKEHLKKKKRTKKSYCEQYKKCPDCLKKLKMVHYTVQAHVCHEQYFCRKCKMFPPPPPARHNCCFNPPLAKEKENMKKKTAKYLLVFYDVETRVVEESDAGELNHLDRHIVNAICYNTVCQECKDVKVDKCSKCPGSGHFYYGNVGEADVTNKFVEMLLYDKKFNNSVIMAHNGGGYDHHFIANSIWKSFGLRLHLVTNGNYIITASIRPPNHSTVNNLSFKDSYSFMPMPLRSMPKAYELEELKKGEYPYYFNQPKNYGKTFTQLPPKKYYNYDKKSIAAREEFDRWYTNHYNDGFDFDKELIEYCEMDVRILRDAAKVHMGICVELFEGSNPFVCAPTLASHVLHVMKYNHIENGDIGYIAENGFPGRLQSALAIKYLLWKEVKEKWDVQHARNGGEFKVTRANGLHYFVDGFMRETNTVIEVQGCVFHGCPKCLPPTGQNVHKISTTNKEVYERVCERREELKSLGYKVIEIWEHEIQAELKKNREMQTFFENCRLTSHLLPREGMFGGRTEVFAMTGTAQAGITIEYEDFCSLYPTVNIRAAEYPRGQPEIINGSFEPIEKGKPVPYKGLVYCVVLPPTDLMLPVLPYRSGGKLLFPLCRKCAEAKDNRVKCEHDKVQDRCLTGTWYSGELNIAIAKGYTILRYLEVWNWTDWLRGGFFSSYLKPLLKMKHESSGWPRVDMSDAEKQAYIMKIEETDGVKLDEHKIKKNPACRGLAKLYLNSAWGKFSENPLKKETQMFERSDGMGQRNFYEADGYELCGITDLEDVTLVSRQQLRGILMAKSYTNIVIGVITTAVGRLTLYDALDRIGREQLLYADTDSIMYLKQDGDNKLGDLIGVGLGKLESEIPKGFTISRFIGLAPKTYSYQLMDDQGVPVKIVVKAKGVTLDPENQKLVTLDAFETQAKAHIDNTFKDPITAKTFRMDKKLLSHIKSVEGEKKVRPVMDKAYLLSDGKTLPLGYFAGVTLNDDFRYYPLDHFMKN